MKTRKKLELKPEELRKKIDADNLGINTTNDVEVKPGEFIVVNQAQAIKSLEFGAKMRDNHYNIFVSGAKGIGKTKITTRVLKQQPAFGLLEDWVYVCNFADESVPKAIDLPAGTAEEFKKDFSEAIKLLRRVIPDILAEAREMYARKKSIDLKALIIAARQDSIIVQWDTKKRSWNVSHVSLEKDDTPMLEEEFDRLPEEKRQEVYEVGKNWHGKVEDLLQKYATMPVPESVKNFVDISFTNMHNISSIRLGAWIEEVKKDIINNINEFDYREESQQPQSFMQPMGQGPSKDFFKRYEINVMSSVESQKAPVLVEFDTSFSNLFGYTEAKMTMAGASADHMDIKPGVIHKANGGYLVLRVYDVVANVFFQFVWPTLKKCIKNQKINAEDLMVMNGRVPKVLDPEPIPWNGKIVLMGEDWWYHTLCHFDEDFGRYFKIKVELHSRSRSDEKDTEKQLIRYIAVEAKKSGKPVNKGGVARLLEYSHELAEHQKKVSLCVSSIRDLIKEANVWAEGEIITAQDIEMALKEKKARFAGYEEALMDYHKDGIFLVETAGCKTGQANGLYVSSTGEDEFGGVSRITATASCGKEGIISIDRQAKMTGESFNKAIGILTKYFEHRFGQEKPITFSAGIVFEQMYDGIDGDSATLVETCALLSALSGLPIRQDLAMTGSMDQMGSAQAIGGINYKIKGFFDLCKIKGLTGKQGVVIPKSNVQDLMLDSEIVEAVRKIQDHPDGKFHIYSVENIEEAAELLMETSFGDICKKVEEKLEKYRKSLNDNNGKNSAKDETDHSCKDCGKCHKLKIVAKKKKR